MFKENKIYLITVLLGLIFISPATFASGKNTKKVSHKVKVLHPAISSTELIETTLIQLKNENRERFYIDVESVSCGDNQCKVVPVRIYFDELGFYNSLELDRGVKLEKAKGKRFKKADYLKLDSILRNTESILARVEKDKLVEQETDLDGVDAVSSATTPLLPENSYVKGAVWTCYTLWHWANGGLSAFIRNIVGDSKTNQQLNLYLKNGNEKYRYFALEQIIRLEKYEREIVECVLHLAPKSNSSEQNLVISYFKKGAPDLYFSSIQQLLETTNKELRIKCLNSVSDSEKEIPKDFNEQLSRQLNTFETYQEIDISLNILEKRDSDNSVVNNQVLDLLERNDILTARRAYWFLMEKNLPEEQRKILAEFYKTHSDYF